MTAGWVAASTRSGLVTDSLLGSDGARAVATAPTWAQALEILSSSVYGAELEPAADRGDCRRHAMAATAWQLRVLAGWLPPGRHSLAR